MAGEIIIGTKVDTTGLEKDLQNIENKTDVKDIKFNANTQSIQETEEALDGVESDVMNVEQIVQEMTNTFNEMFGTTIDWREVLQDMFNEPNDKAIDLSKTIKKIGSGIESIGKSMLKTGLLMMGIQSAMSMWRQSFNRVKEGHPELQKAVEHIQGAFDYIVSSFMTRLEPYLPRLLEFADKILNIIMQVGDILLDVVFPILEGVVWLIEKIVDGLVWMYNNLSILSTYTGTISTDTSEFSSNAEKFANNIRKSNKETSKLRKQLMGFDEMNILNDNGSTGNINKIIEDINKKPKLNTNTIKDIFGLDEEETKWYALEIGAQAGAVGAQIVEAFEGLKKSNIGELLFGTIRENKKELKEVEKNVKDFIFNNNKARQDAIDEFKKQSWVQSMFGSNEEIQEAGNQATQNIKGLNDEIFEAIRRGSYKVKDGFYEIKLASGQTIKYTKDEFNQLKSVVDATGEAGKKSADKTKTSWNETGTSVNNTSKNMETNAKTNSTNISNIWTTALGLITQTSQSEGQKQKDNSSKNTKEIINDTKTQIDNYNKNPKTTKVPVEEDPKKNVTTTTNEIKNKVNKTTLPKLQVAVEVVQKSMNNALTTIKNFFAGKGVTLPAELKIGSSSSKYSAKGSIINYPRLASGGIINRPGRGVMLANGGAIGGERGREAVIPLTDSGQMELLGQAIARNIVVNLTNEVRLDGKQLSRYISRVMQDTEFTSNGGVI